MSRIWEYDNNLKYHNYSMLEDQRLNSCFIDDHVYYADQSNSNIIDWLIVCINRCNMKMVETSFSTILTESEGSESSEGIIDNSLSNKHTLMLQ